MEPTAVPREKGRTRGAHGDHGESNRVRSFRVVAESSAVDGDGKGNGIRAKLRNT